MLNANTFKNESKKFLNVKTTHFGVLVMSQKRLNNVHVYADSPSIHIYKVDYFWMRQNKQPIRIERIDIFQT